MKNKFLLQAITLITLSLSVWGCKSFYPTNIEVSSYRFESTNDFDQDDEMESILSNYREKLVKETQEVIGKLEMQLNKQKPESTLGNFFTDLFYESGSKLWSDHTDFAIQNYGGLRRPSLPKGDLTVGHIYELMPFENYVARIKGDSTLIHTLFNKIAAYGGWPISSQVKFVIRNKEAVNITIDGQALSNDRNYAFILPDYIANGGDRFSFLKPLKKDITSVLIRDALIDNLKLKYKNGKTISSKLTGRISLE